MRRSSKYYMWIPFTGCYSVSAQEVANSGLWIIEELQQETHVNLCTLSSIEGYEWNKQCNFTLLLHFSFLLLFKVDIIVHILGVHGIFWYIYIIWNYQVRVIGVSITSHIYLFLILGTLQFFSSYCISI